ncbi:MAG: MerR family transcriptional regulator [Oligoflexia bacterium]|nr:MerR family transcriptional regulator [Oligoflexia bacterium]
MNQIIEIPNKSFFKLNEVCALTSVKPYVLRFWESEFEEISPTTSSSGQKLYEHKDIEAILLIKKLLFEEKMTVEAAKAEIMTRMSAVREDLMPTKSQEDYDLEDENGSEEQTFENTIDQMIDDEYSLSRQALTENEISKLMNAKERLADILSRTQNIKNTHNWVQ